MVHHHMDHIIFIALTGDAEEKQRYKLYAFCVDVAGIFGPHPGPGIDLLEPGSHLDCSFFCVELTVFWFLLGLGYTVYSW